MSRASRMIAGAGALLLAFAPALASGQSAAVPASPDGFRWADSGPVSDMATPADAAPVPAPKPKLGQETPSLPEAADASLKEQPAPSETPDPQGEGSVAPATPDLAAQPPAEMLAFGSQDAAVTAEGAARLFERVCLATLPDFAGAGALFEALGFVGAPGMRIRNHPRMNISALAMTPEEIRASGVRSCAVLVGGLAQSPALGAVEPIVKARFGPVRRYEIPGGDVAHVVWMVETPAGPAKVLVTESGDSAFLGATVLPARAGAEP